jgi:hypothetical protein
MRRRARRNLRDRRFDAGRIVAYDADMDGHRRNVRETTARDATMFDHEAA